MSKQRSTSVEADEDFSNIRIYIRSVLGLYSLLQYSGLTIKRSRLVVSMSSPASTKSLRALEYDLLAKRSWYILYRGIKLEAMMGSGLRFISEVVRKYIFNAVAGNFRRISFRSFETWYIVLGEVYDEYANSSVRYVLLMLSRYLEISTCGEVGCFLILFRFCDSVNVLKRMVPKVPNGALFNTLWYTNYTLVAPFVPYKMLHAVNKHHA